MPAFDRDDQKLQVQQATDLVRLIGEHVALKPKGKEFLGLCPFHEDKNPSMHVSPAKQIYKCFSCGAGGDAFSFVMNFLKMTFPEALTFLAERAGIKLTPLKGASGGNGAEDADGGGSGVRRNELMEALAKGVEFYRAAYRHPEIGKAARAYVEARRINQAMVDAFQIGYAPDGWDHLANGVRDRGYNIKAFEAAGLISLRKEGNGHYDRLRHRLIFPICDNLGRPVAFGGRKMREEDEPKYLNSPETPVFHKSATLYGLHLARAGIGSSKTAVIVEGYTDVIACHQAGVTNVVATLGTALTPDHATKLRYMAEKVVLIFDADEAGQKAADRALEIVFLHGVDVAIAVLPDELDPAELFEQANGLERWHQTVAGAVDALEFQFARFTERFGKVDTTSGKERLAQEYLQGLARLGIQRAGILRKSLLLRKLSGLLHIGEAALSTMLERMGAPPRSVNPRPPTAALPNPQEVAGIAENSGTPVAPPPNVHKIKALRGSETLLLGCLLQEPSLFHHTLTDGRTLDEVVTPAQLYFEDTRGLYDMLYTRLAEGATLKSGQVLAELAEAGKPEWANLATQALRELDEAAGQDAERLVKILTDTVQQILQRDWQESYAEVVGSQPEQGAGQDQRLKRIAELNRTSNNRARILTRTS